MTTDQQRADFEAWCIVKYGRHTSTVRSQDGYAHSAVHQALPSTYASVQMLWEAYQAGQAALQSKDMKSVIDALETAQNNTCGPVRPFGSSDPNSDDYDQDAFMWDYYQRAIDHARRIEGEGK